MIIKSKVEKHWFEAKEGQFFWEAIVQEPGNWHEEAEGFQQWEGVGTKD